MTRQTPKAAAGIQLFPFLAVLLCTMGALLLMLVVIARNSRDKAAKMLLSQPQVNAQVAAQSAAVAKRIEEMKAIRDQLAGQFDEVRDELSHTEDHSRRIRDEMQRLRQAAIDLKRSDESDDETNNKLRKRLANYTRDIEDLKQDVAKADEDRRRKPDSYAIIPYDGPNQTRRRPIYIECRADGVILQPEGIVFNEVDFLGPMGPSNPLASALRAEREYLIRSRQAGSGEDGQPYPLLLVRPNGIPNYYGARQAMASWGADFGYELVEADWDLAYPAPNPALAATLAQAVEEARRRQILIAAAAPNLMTPDQRIAFQNANAQRGGHNGGRSPFQAGNTEHKRRTGSNGRGAQINGYDEDQEVSARNALSTYAKLDLNGSRSGSGGTGGGTGTGTGAGTGNGTGGPNSAGGPTGAGGPNSAGGAPGTGPGGNAIAGGGGAGPNGMAGGGFGTAGGPAGNGYGPGGGGPGGPNMGAGAGGPAATPGGVNPWGYGASGAGGAYAGAGGGPMLGNPGLNGNSAVAMGSSQSGFGPGGSGTGLASNGTGAGTNFNDGTGGGGATGAGSSAAGGGPGGTGAAGNGPGGASATTGGPGAASGDGNNINGALASNGAGGPGGQSGASGQGNSGAQGAGGQPGGSGGQPGGSGGGSGTSGNSMGTQAGGSSGASGAGGMGGGGMPMPVAIPGMGQVPSSDVRLGNNQQNSGSGGKSNSGKSGSSGQSGSPYGSPGSDDQMVSAQKARNGPQSAFDTAGQKYAQKSPTAETSSYGGSTSSSGASNSSSSGSSSSSKSSLSKDQKQQLKQQTKSRRGKWALPEETHTAVPVSRPITVECYGDRLVLVSGRGEYPPTKTIAFDSDTSDTVEPLVSQVWERINGWGVAGDDMYWRPVLMMTVEPGGEGRAKELQQFLANSGLELKQRPPRTASRK